MGLTPTTPATTTPGETLLEFPDNRLLIDLCGPHDRHLARIEEALQVHVLRRGNLLSVVGPAEAQAEAACDAGHGLAHGDVGIVVRYAFDEQLTELQAVDRQPEECRVHAAAGPRAAA